MTPSGRFESRPQSAREAARKAGAEARAAKAQFRTQPPAASDLTLAALETGSGGCSVLFEFTNGYRTTAVVMSAPAEYRAAHTATLVEWLRSQLPA